MGDYEPLNISRSRKQKRIGTIQISVLVVLVLNLLMLIVFYITFIESLELVSNSPVLKKLRKVNLDNLMESLQMLDLKSLIQVFQRIEIRKIENFIDSVISLADQVNTDDIIEFVQGIDTCITNKCYH